MLCVDKISGNWTYFILCIDPKMQQRDTKSKFHEIWYIHRLCGKISKYIEVPDSTQNHEEIFLWELDGKYTPEESWCGYKEIDKINVWYLKDDRKISQWVIFRYYSSIHTVVVGTRKETLRLNKTTVHPISKYDCNAVKLCVLILIVTQSQ